MSLHEKLIVLAVLLLIGYAFYGMAEKSSKLMDAVLEDVCAWLITEEGFESCQIILSQGHGDRRER